MDKLKKLLIILSAAVFLAACESSVKLDEDVRPETDSRTVSTVSTGSTDPLNDPKGELAKRSIYFEFNSYVVQDEYQSLVQAHARYLNKNKNRRILIQGNTDERGGREYNLALGQKRAEAVRKSMSLLGVSDSQMEAVSFGKEKPRAQGSDEASWAENRRADIVYQ
ncbi:peptidoglycan-associated lipoprotein Pal [Oxalobacter vibrioformis]|uniref:Peptidoglycan-associated lipoprotein n=1 Tax=Oxalobacter vibrioformis TaxID=933080 RepID=A0A9E9P380_9BURK|nr:peptidoglycan-associated lipoprotein Pal [Oxalobacter vibrioformis]NLC24773.1 peptidoglycan-associated lipoprotein Pal [Oxalobacter sp.]WAW10722.1 peptidoglycan-associated lipoprotein Pal [Oxalobacter vibrioformis]